VRLRPRFRSRLQLRETGQSEFPTLRNAAYSFNLLNSAVSSFGRQIPRWLQHLNPDRRDMEGRAILIRSPLPIAQRVWPGSARHFLI
jgi:hypothetical protein